MKVELTLPALERLIGGDTELEVALRNQIVQEFARRHLREVVKTASYESAVEVAKQFVNEAAKESFDVENLATSHLWPTVGYRLKSMIETLVNDAAQKAVDEAIAGIIKCQSAYWKREISVVVDKAINQQIEKLVEEGIQKRLKAAMQ